MTSDLMHNHINNPCIGYCKLNDDDICAGCGRSKDERTDWVFLTSKQKQQVVEKAQQRMLKIEKPADLT